MTKLIDIRSLKGVNGFKVQIIERDKKVWLRLSAIDESNFFAFWSQSDLDSLPVDEVLTELACKLKGLDINNEADIHEALKYWPHGWDYWSLGMPAPLLDYLEYEFEDDLEAYKKK